MHTGNVLHGMLVRLGKVTELDIRETSASFRHLDMNNEGMLNCKGIIAGTIAKRRNSRISAMTSNVSCSDLHELGGRPIAMSPTATIATSSQPKNAQPWFGRQESLPVTELDRMNHYYSHIPDSYAIFGKRSAFVTG
jgi:hypothetical protein